MSPGRGLSLPPKTYESHFIHHDFVRALTNATPKIPGTVPKNP